MLISEKIKYLLEMPVEEIIASTASLDLIRCYSQIYLYGAQCRSCSNSQRKYYAQIKKDGLKLALQMEAPRNYIPLWDGLKYIHAHGRHYDSRYITDEQSERLINEGFLTLSDFKPIAIREPETIAPIEQPKKSKGRPRK